MIIKNKILWIAVGTIALLSIAMLAVPSSAAYYNQKDEKIISKQEEKRIGALDLYLDELEKLECRNCGPQFKRLDSNKKFSYGCLQFQSATWREMVRRHDPNSKGKTDAEIHSRIYECPYQKKIAGAMFTEDKVKAANHWYTSIYKKGLGLP